MRKYSWDRSLNWETAEADRTVGVTYPARSDFGEYSGRVYLVRTGDGARMTIEHISTQDLLVDARELASRGVVLDAESMNALRASLLEQYGDGLSEFASMKTTPGLTGAKVQDILLNPFT